MQAPGVRTGASLGLPSCPTPPSGVSGVLLSLEVSLTRTAFSSGQSSRAHSHEPVLWAQRAASAARPWLSFELGQASGRQEELQPHGLPASREWLRAPAPESRLPGRGRCNESLAPQLCRFIYVSEHLSPRAGKMGCSGMDGVPPKETSQS